MTLADSRKMVALSGGDETCRESLAGLLGELGYGVCDAAEANAAVVIANLGQDAFAAAVQSRGDGPSPPLVAWGGPPSGNVADAWLPARPSREDLSFAVAAALRQGRLRADLVALAARLAEAEAELSRLLPLAVLGEAAAGLNHDINNPLCSVSLNAQLLIMTLGSRLEERSLEKLRSIEANADRIKALTQRFATTKRDTLGSGRDEASIAT